MFRYVKYCDKAFRDCVKNCSSSSKNGGLGENLWGRMSNWDSSACGFKPLTTVIHPAHWQKALRAISKYPHRPYPHSALIYWQQCLHLLYYRPVAKSTEEINNVAIKHAVFLVFRTFYFKGTLRFLYASWHWACKADWIWGFICASVGFSDRSVWVMPRWIGSGIPLPPAAAAQLCPPGKRAHCTHLCKHTQRSVRDWGDLVSEMLEKYRGSDTPLVREKAKKEEWVMDRWKEMEGVIF